MDIVTGEFGEIISVGAIKIGSQITFKDDDSHWGIVKSFCDDGSGVYYSPKGTHLGYSFATLDRVVLDQ